MSKTIISLAIIALVGLSYVDYKMAVDENAAQQARFDDYCTSHGHSENLCHGA